MTTKEAIISILEENKGLYISGEDIGKNLNISRSAVSKVIKDLKENGYLIESINKKGHCIPYKSNTISKIEIKKNLINNHEIIIKDSVKSTNLEAKSHLLDECKHGSIIIANEQTNGRGRKGRVFYSPKDTGIYMSLILKPDLLLIHNPLKLTIATAVAVCNSIDTLCDVDTKIKWVNDIFLNNKKICGILTEANTDFETGSIEDIIIGIGLNFNTLNFPEDFSDIAGSIFSEKTTPINRNQLIAEIINNIMKLLKDLENPNILKFYKEKSFLLGKNISFYEKDKKIECTVLDINSEGNLVIKTKNGLKKILHSGEVNFNW